MRFKKKKKERRKKKKKNLQEGLISYLLLKKLISQTKEIEKLFSKIEDYNPGTASEKAF